MLNKGFDDFRGQHDTHPKWYKFDDGDVMECKMDDDEVKKIKKNNIMDCFFGWLVGWLVGYFPAIFSSFPLLASACRCEQR